MVTVVVMLMLFRNFKDTVIHSSNQIPCSSDVFLCVGFSRLAILRIEGCLNSTLEQYSWDPLVTAADESMVGATVKVTPSHVMPCPVTFYSLQSAVLCLFVRLPAYRQVTQSTLYIYNHI